MILSMDRNAKVTSKEQNFNTCNKAVFPKPFLAVPLWLQYNENDPTLTKLY